MEKIKVLLIPPNERPKKIKIRPMESDLCQTVGAENIAIVKTDPQSKIHFAYDPEANKKGEPQNVYAVDDVAVCGNVVMFEANAKHKIKSLPDVLIKSIIQGWDEQVEGIGRD